jgi:hypothetical protein
MFIKYFKIIDSGKFQSQIEIARQLAISPEMVNQIEQKSIALGYLKELGENCASNLSECSNCPVNKNCNISFRKLSLTDKGKKAILNDGKDL